MVPLPDEPAMPEPEAVMGVALERKAARPPRRVNVPMHQDAVIADRYGVRDGVCVGLPPSRQVLGKEGANLLLAVACSRLREAAHGVVVAIGLPELRNPRLNVFQVSAEYFLEPPPHYPDVLLRHRPRSISPKGAAFHAKRNGRFGRKAGAKPTTVSST